MRRAVSRSISKGRRAGGGRLGSRSGSGAPGPALCHGDGGPDPERVSGGPAPDRVRDGSRLHGPVSTDGRRAPRQPESKRCSRERRCPALPQLQVTVRLRSDASIDASSTSGSPVRSARACRELTAEDRDRLAFGNVDRRRKEGRSKADGYWEDLPGVEILTRKASTPAALWSRPGSGRDAGGRREGGRPGGRPAHRGGAGLMVAKALHARWGARSPASRRTASTMLRSATRPSGRRAAEPGRVGRHP